MGSDRGTSSAMHNPFIALRRATTTEADGEAIGFSLVYSGNFIAEAEVDPFDTTRVRIGISPDSFSWTLEPGADLRHPGGHRRPLDDRARGMSDALHGLYRERLARGTWRDAPRPVLINNSEATYFGSTRRSCSVSRARRATSASSCSCSTTAGSASAIRTIRHSATGCGKAQAATGSTALDFKVKALVLRSGSGSSPRWSATGPAVRGTPGLGGRRPGAAAHRAPPAAGPRPVAARGRRPPCSALLSRARRSRTSSGT